MGPIATEIDRPHGVRSSLDSDNIAQAPGTSQKCHVGTHAPQQMTSLLDCHLVRRVATRRDQTAKPTSSDLV